jgi:hypothetical protein
MKPKDPLGLLRHHVTGAIERGEATPIVETPDWPKNPDGTPKRMGELTPAQQREQFSAALKRLKPEFANLGVKLVEGKDH